jgi:hypothetical protein
MVIVSGIINRILNENGKCERNPLIVIMSKTYMGTWRIMTFNNGFLPLVIALSQWLIPYIIPLSKWFITLVHCVSSM